MQTALPEQPTLPVAELDEFPKNPRTHWGDMAGLAESIQAKGVIEPLVVRRVGARYQVIAGARRLRAAKVAGLLSVPVALRQVDDQDALELAILENLQRHDVHPLDEALGYASLQKADRAYTPEAIAAKVGKSVSYVYRRLKLVELIPEARKAFNEDRILAAHAERLARLTKAQQKDALDECFLDLFRGDADATEPAPISRLDAWIDKHVRIEPASADAQHYFPEIASEVEAEGAALLQLSESHTPSADLGERQKGIVGRASWTRITGPKNRCPHVRKGVVVHGGPMRVIEVCAQKGCSKHRPAPKRPTVRAGGGATPDPAKAAAAEAKRQADIKRRELEREIFNLATRSALRQVCDSTSAIEDEVIVGAISECACGDLDADGFHELTGVKVGGWNGLDDKARKALLALSPKLLRQALTFAVYSGELMSLSDAKVPAWFKAHDVDFVACQKAARAKLAVDEAGAPVAGKSKKVAKKR